jgi:hypothetical protein
VPVDKDSGQRVDLTRLATPEMTRAYAGASDAMALWLEDRLTTPKTANARGFTLKPAAADDDPPDRAPEPRGRCDPAPMEN